jgi:hypothetical protein
MEIKAAIDSGASLLPILVEDGLMPESRRVPPSISTLLRMNAIRLRHESFELDMSRIETVISNAFQHSKDDI